jgi:hypothetical protein
MAELEKTKVAKKKVATRRMFVGVDKTYENVLQLQEQGHDLYFKDDEDTFLELTEEQVLGLSPKHKIRYTVAKRIVFGDDVIGDAVNGMAGYDTKAFNVREGSASANLAVAGKEPGWEHSWFRPDQHNNKLSQGWIVDESSSHTRHSAGESGNRKYVGGQAKPELILYRRPKEVSDEFKKKRREIRNGRLKKSQNSARETIERAGGKIIE